MPERTSHPHGTPSWVDLATTDIDAAVAFYEPVLGWTAGPDQGSEAGHHRMFTVNGRSVAGGSPLAAATGMPPVWTSYVTVDDVDTAVERVVGAGGAVLAPPFELLASGRMATITDPGGAALGLWQPRDHIGAELVNEPVALCWNELNTREPDRAAAFFGEVLGWDAVETESAGPSRYWVFRLGDREIAGMLLMTEEWGEMPSHWMVYFAVDDCDATVQRVTGGGGEVHVGPMDGPPGRFAVVADPQGAAFSVMALAEPGD